MNNYSIDDMKNILTVAIFIVAVLAFSYFFLVGENPQDSTSEGVNNVTSLFADDSFFILEDYDGNTIDSEDFNEEILIVNTWATWCPFCVNELPDFAKVKQAFGERIAVIAINRAESLETAQGFSDDLNLGDDIIFLMDPKDTF